MKSSRISEAVRATRAIPLDYYGTVLYWPCDPLRQPSPESRFTLSAPPSKTYGRSLKRCRMFWALHYLMPSMAVIQTARELSGKACLAP